MTIYRSARATASRDTFEVTPLGSNPVTATVEPPAPFSGTALYEKKPGGETSWSGDLAVELPGRGEQLVFQRVPHRGVGGDRVDDGVRDLVEEHLQVELGH